MSRPAATWLSLLAFTLCASAQSRQSSSLAGQVSSPFSMLFSEYGEGSNVRPALCGTLAAFREGQIAFPFKHDTPVNPVTRLERVGLANDSEIYEVSYFTKLKTGKETSRYDLYTMVHASLVRWGTGDNYCAFRVSSVPGSREEFDHWGLPRGGIVELDEPLYVLLIRTPGTGYFWDESYYAFDDGMPVPLGLDQQAGALAGQFSPEGCDQRKGGSFCHQHMEWRSGLWREGDANCCPSCGAISVRFRYQKRKLSVIDHSVFPSHEAMRQARTSPGCRQ